MNLDNLFPTLRSRSTSPDVFHDLRSGVSRVFDEYNKLFPMSQSLDPDEREDHYLRPRLDVKETENSIDIVVDVPGVKESDLEVQIDGRNIVLKGKRSEETLEDNKHYKIVERSYGSFMRSITLPFEPESERVAGKLDAGVLTLTVDKPREVVEKVKTVKITTADNSAPPPIKSSSEKRAKPEGDTKNSDTASTVQA